MAGYSGENGEWSHCQSSKLGFLRWLHRLTLLFRVRIARGNILVASFWLLKRLWTLQVSLVLFKMRGSGLYIYTINKNMYWQRCTWYAELLARSLIFHITGNGKKCSQDFLEIPVRTQATAIYSWKRVHQNWN